MWIVLIARIVDVYLHTTLSHVHGWILVAAVSTVSMGVTIPCCSSYAMLISGMCSDWGVHVQCISIKGSRFGTLISLMGLCNFLGWPPSQSARCNKPHCSASVIQNPFA